MRKLHPYRYVLLICIILAMLFPNKAQAAEEDSAKAKTLRLEKTEGVVTVENAKGKEVSVRAGGKLYNGYQITTEDGYAWFSLDDTKVIKLDWYSEVTVRKNGKKLEILLDSGNLFFNVSKPLEDDETLDIRTSTMSTGVRGTLGKIHMDQSIDAFHDTRSASVELYEGKVVVAYEVKDGMVQTDDVGIGYRADVSSERHQDFNLGFSLFSEATLTDITTKDALTENGFVAVEVKADENLQKRIVEADNGIDESTLQEIVQNAEEQLEKDQTLMKEMIQDLSREIKAEEMQPQISQVFELEASAKQETAEEPQKEDSSKTPDSEPQNTVPETEPEKNISNYWPSVQVEEPVKPGETLTPAIGLPQPAAEQGTTSSGQNKNNTNKVELIPTVYTVVFTVNGSNFASADVMSGSLVLKPVLRPTEKGSWQLNGSDYNFNTAVKQNLVLVWKAHE